ncbi:MAG: LysE family translocator [Alphaproteobacteria bacterium]
MTSHLWAFVGISVLVIVTPGPDTALTIRNSLLGGRSGGLATALGVATGQTIWALATSLGMVGLLAASASVFAAVKLLGAAYLIYLGIEALVRALRPAAAGASGPVRGAWQRLAPARAFRQGVISNLVNPKMAVFFMSLLPQFAPARDASFAALAMLGIIFAAMTLTWLAGYALAAARAGDFLSRPRIRRALEAATGAALVALGLRLAAEEP